ncbi:MAG TPA: CheR family methyltransferase [Patescibacteria group bacterium]|nr:CheR family methyltransferase [Patescibacteria group bacterium]
MTNDSENPLHSPFDSLPESAGIHVEEKPKSTANDFYVVALGGSAGSLSALEKFFKNLPPDMGMAFVVVSHLDQSRENMLPGIIRRWTKMPVIEAEEGMALQPNRVFMMPETAYMSILNEKLHLIPRQKEGGHHLPIDLFFQSLAKDVKHRAIGVVLSGMDGDGSIGVKVIMENLGLVIAQEPTTAEFDSMPLNAIATELVDYVLPPEEIPEKILSYASNPLPKSLRNASYQEGSNALQKIITTIKTVTGHDFSQYKRNTILRRIERRMQSQQMKHFSEYLKYLDENTLEVDLLFKELLIGVTKFFRDAEAFRLLKERLLEYIRTTKFEDNTFRVWVAACSTGEEAYSIAILLLECIEELKKDLKIQIFATDINNVAIELSRLGTYPHNIEGDVSQERLSKYFTRHATGEYTVKKAVREQIIFATHNLTKDAPFTKLNLLTCRNFLIYISAEMQKRLIPVFNYALQKDGILFLGPSEALNGYSEYFSVLESKWKIYQKTNVTSALSRMVDFPFTFPVISLKSSVIERAVMPETLIPNVIQKILVAEFAPPCVIINSKGEILYINGRTGKYLELSPGVSIMNIFMMAREGLKYALSSAIQRAASENMPQLVERVNVKTNGHYEMINLRVRPLVELQSLKGLMLVVFEDAGIEEGTAKAKRKTKSKAAAVSSAEIAELEKELEYTRMRLQMTTEEMETSLEELKSTNEELQSANEELQSTNEEAMTNKEEMLSLNEELMAINMQYQAKGQELAEINNDIKNLLDSTDIATIFVDNEINIKRFTPKSTQILNIIPTDVGRPLEHISTNLEYTAMISDVRDVLEHLTKKEVQVKSKSGHWFSMRISPYRTLSNYIDGVVITFSDITTIKQYEEKLLKSEMLLKEAQRMAHIGHFEFDMKKGELNWSDELYRIYGYQPGTFTPDRHFFEKTSSAEELKEITKIIENSLQTLQPFSFERRVKTHGGSVRIIHTEGIFLKDESGKPRCVIGIEQDVTDRKKTEDNLHTENASLKRN